MYISQDPIGLAGNNPNFYADVFDSNIQVDVFGLDYNTIEKVRELVDKIPDEDKAVFKCKDFAEKLKSLMKTVKERLLILYSLMRQRVSI